MPWTGEVLVKSRVQPLRVKSNEKVLKFNFYV